jgi:thiamine-phosphate diphosphorylase
MQTIDPDIRKYDKYFITPDYNHDIAYEYYLKIESALKSGIQLLQFRSKNLSVVEYSEIAGKIYGLCKTYRVKFIINDYKNLELNLYCDGVQLTSENLRNIEIKNINKKYIIIGSCHNIKEIEICNNSRVNLVVISPILNTSKKNGIGWKKFKKLASFSKYPVFGLGGLDYNVDINNVKKNGGIGIAASSYFYNLFNSRE